MKRNELALVTLLLAVMVLSFMTVCGFEIHHLADHILTGFGGGR